MASTDIKILNLFEYQNRVEYKDSFNSLDDYLDNIWKRREKTGFYFKQFEEKAELQQFLLYFHKTQEIKSNKYVGIIHFEDRRINLLPKIFYEEGKEYTSENIFTFQNHILWWLSYCRKIKFPNYQTSLGEKSSDFFEILIYLFAKYTRELLSSSVFRQYEEINRELSFIKGRLNVNEYINENLSKARWHKLNCTYDAFIMDNKFNRIIKHVAAFLVNVTRNDESKKYLREILFILDEVTDERATAEDCLKIHFNPMFEDFETVRDYCYLFLRHSISLEYKNSLKLFAFLLPMEYVFEDFIFGFIEREVKGINAKAHNASKYLDSDHKFGLNPDLILNIGKKEIIADTKYKIVYKDENDPKNGISQNDLYQMVAYAIRFKINEIMLFYPDSMRDKDLNSDKLIIKDEFSPIDITIGVHQLPVINREMLSPEYTHSAIRLDEAFVNVKNELVDRLKEILF